MTATAHMPLLERLRKGANCVGFLDGAPEPAADVADMLRKAADEIERLQRIADQRKNKKEIAVTARNRHADGIEYWKTEAERLRAALETAANWIDPNTDPSNLKAGEMAASLRATLAYQQIARGN